MAQYEIRVTEGGRSRVEARVEAEDDEAAAKVAVRYQTRLVASRLGTTQLAPQVDFRRSEHPDRAFLRVGCGS